MVLILTRSLRVGIKRFGITSYKIPKGATLHAQYVDKLDRGIGGCVGLLGVGEVVLDGAVYGGTA